MRSLGIAILLGGALPVLASCGGDKGASADAGSDSGTGSDADADGGKDSGSGTETDADTDTGPGDAATWVSAGAYHSCAVVEGGYVKCWGSDTFGALGYGFGYDFPDGTDLGLPSTLPFVNVGGAVAEVDAGGYHTCALLADGTAKCWGPIVPNPHDESTWHDYVPAEHEPLDFGGATVTKILAAEGGFAIALLEGGDVSCLGTCWGGPGVVELGAPATQVCAGSSHTCAVIEGGDLYCWGEGGGGALGYGDTDDVWMPEEKGPVDVGGAIVHVACGDDHTCAVLESGDVRCWGLGGYGRLGYGNTDEVGDDETPASVGPVDVGAPVEQIALGAHHTCALVEGGDVKCWGQGAGGQLGYGNPENIGDDEVPADVGVVNVGGIVTQVDAGMVHTCALLETGEISCWGYAGNGQLGYGSGEDIGDDETPADIGPVQLF